MPLTPEQQALRDAALKATPGPWTYGTKWVAKPTGTGAYRYIAQCPDGKEGSPEWEGDAQFIAAAEPAAILALLAQLEAQEAPSPMDNLRKNEPEFAAHLDRCSAEVDTWPKWKRMGYGEACGCAKCKPEDIGRRMILCATCGNKRCPHATDHALTCTNSNEPGQPGSSYGPPLSEPLASTPGSAGSGEQDRFFTAVYKIPAKHAAEFAAEACSSTYLSAVSWSHAMDDRDAARAALSQPVQAVPDASLGQKLRNEYECGTAVSDFHGPKITLRYRNMRAAESAFEALVGLIDAAAATPGEPSQ